MNEPERLRPIETVAQSWRFIDTITNGIDVADRWQCGTVCVVSTVDFEPVPRHWEYHLSVHVEGASKTPPSEIVLQAVCAAFGLPAALARRESAREKPGIVHLYADVP